MLRPKEAYFDFPKHRTLALFVTRLATGWNVRPTGYGSRAKYAVAPDGQFLLNVTLADSTASPIVLVLNWDAALEK